MFVVTLFMGFAAPQIVRKVVVYTDSGEVACLMVTTAVSSDHTPAFTARGTLILSPVSDYEVSVAIAVGDLTAPLVDSADGSCGTISDQSPSVAYSVIGSSTEAANDFASLGVYHQGSSRVEGSGVHLSIFGVDDSTSLSEILFAFKNGYVLRDGDPSASHHSTRTMARRARQKHPKSGSGGIRRLTGANNSTRSV